MAFLTRREGEDKERTLPRSVTLRRGTADDEPATFDVMRRTMNAEMNWANHAATRHHLRNSPAASFWIAEDTPRFGSPRIIGYARSIVRERVWNLNEFFLLPSQHRQGIGGALLSHCLQDGEEAGADTHLVLASQHPGADSLYIRKAHCLPREPMLLLAGPTANLRLPASPQAPIVDALLTAMGLAREPIDSDPHTLYAEPLTLTPSIQEILNTLDRQILGYARPPEHALWAAEMGGPRGASRLFRSRANGEDRIVGYAYLGPHSSGPALALDPEDQPRMLFHAATVSRALARSSLDLGMIYPIDQYCALGGTNGVMLNWLLACGWQIVFQYLFMCSRPLAQLDRYVCHNPLYFP